jgi:predicted GNAT family acetyltransferase
MTSASARFSVVDVPERERFEIRDGDQLAGLTQYQLHPREIAIVHTEIEPRFEGQGLGSRLVAAALEAARRQDLAVPPECASRSYIAAHLDAYLELVPRTQRERPSDG